MMTKEAVQVIPPYIPYKTFTRFVSSLKGDTLPGRIDRSVMREYSGQSQTLLLMALRYFVLINESGDPQPTLIHLANAEGTEFRVSLKQLLMQYYPFIFDVPNFNLTNATPLQFDTQFRLTGAHGDTVKKCQSFFLAAAKDAGIPVSSRITDKIRTKPQGTKRPARSNNTSNQKTDAVSSTQLALGPSVGPTSIKPIGSDIIVVDLPESNVRLTFSVEGNIWRLPKGKERDLIFDIIDRIELYKGQAREEESLMQSTNTPDEA